MHWLPADLADLYFDWPAFSMTCLSSVILRLVHGLRDIPTMESSQHDMFHVAKFVLEYANDGKLIKSPMGFLERKMLIIFVRYAWQSGNQEVQREIKEGEFGGGMRGWRGRRRGVCS
jgi:hypothetical protein